MSLGGKPAPIPNVLPGLAKRRDTSSGIPRDWRADGDSPGLDVVAELTPKTADSIAARAVAERRPIGVYRDRLILYGCGDCLDDYEGIRGYEHDRGDLAIGYFPTLDPRSGRLLALALEPFQARRFRLCRPDDELTWLVEKLSSVGKAFGTRVEAGARGSLAVHWCADSAR